MTSLKRIFGRSLPFACVLLALFCCAGAQASDVPQGDEVEVNGAEDGRQTLPRAASDANGNVVVVWSEDSRFNPLPAVPGGIYARLFAADGTPKTGNLRVHDRTPSGLDVAFAPDGSFLVVWARSSADLMARRYEADGTPRADAFTVGLRESGAGASPENPAISFKADGSYVAAWHRGTTVFLRRFGTNDQPTHSEGAIGFSGGSFVQPDAAYVPGGNSIIMVYRYFGEIKGRQFIEDNSSVGLMSVGGTGDPNEFTVDASLNTGTSSGLPRIAMGVANQYLVAWNVGASGGEATRPAGVYARGFTLKTPAAAAFLINAPRGEGDTGRRGDVEAVFDAEAGNYLAVWTRTANTSGSTTLDEIRARRLNALSPVGEEFTAASAASDGSFEGAVRLPAITTPRSADPPRVGDPQVPLGYTIAWQATGGGGTDIFARRFGPPPPTEVDLSITVASDRPGEARQAGSGGPIGYQVIVTNNDASDAATTVSASLETSVDGLRINNTLDFDSCRQINPRRLICDLNVPGGLPPGSFKRFFAELPIPETSQTLTATGEALLAERDPVPANNTDVSTIRILNGGRIRFVSLTGAAAFTASEGNSSVAVRVERVDGSEGEASVTLSPLRGTASLEEDFILPTEPLKVTWADGESGEKTFPLALHDDTLDEADEENASLSFAGVIGARTGTPTFAALVIRDNDEPAKVQFDSTGQTQPEGGHPVSILLSLDTTSGKEITVHYTTGGTATLGEDYTLSPPSPLIFAEGVTEFFLDLIPINDTEVEPAEDIVLVLSTPDNADLGERTAHTLTIPASDQPNPADLSAMIGSNIAGIRTGGRAPVELLVRNNGPANATEVTSQFRINLGAIVGFPQGPSGGLNCELSNENLFDGFNRFLICTIPGGLASEQEVSYLVEIEAPGEPGEIRAQHSVFSNQPDPALGNNDAERRFPVLAPQPGRVRFSITQIGVDEESDRTRAITVIREGGEGSASVRFRVAAGGTAFADDYDVPGQNGSLVFSENHTVESFIISILDDTAPEGLESFQVELFDPQGTEIDPSARVLTVVIADDDQGPGDTRPNAFTVTNSSGQTQQSGAEPGEPVTSEPFTVSGLGGPADISVSGSGGGKSTAGGAQYSINGGAFTNSAGTVNNGDTVRLRVFASATPGATTTAILTIGGVSSSFSVTTASATSVSGTSQGGGSLGWLSLLLGLVPALRRLRLLALLLCASTVNAGEYYAGLRGGRAMSGIDSASLTAALRARGHAVTAAVDDRSNGGTFYVGRQLTPQFSLELGFGQIGDYNLAVSGSSANPAQFRADLADLQPVSGYAISAMGRVKKPLAGRLSTVLRAGLLGWNAQSNFTSGGVTTSLDDEGFGGALGVGFDLALTQALHLGLGWELLVPDTDGATTQFNGGVEYQF